MSFTKIVGIILILVGGYLCYVGNEHRNSLAGGLASASGKVANKFDGEARVADHVWYFVGGGALILIGAASLTRRS
jgi:hypothetical protein